MLVLAGTFSFAAAAAHLACIVGGPGWYRAMGAGERMALAAARGQWRPTIVTLLISAILVTWGLYALSGAGVLAELPLQRWILPVITAVYLLRGLFFMPLRAHFPGNSAAFWYWSSGICAAIGVVHLVGLWQAWG
ncbi:hypothetical protein [Noviherbaspirillum galbum]|nr:hypothetical protein [Noviherbaspirillum galbum]